MLHVDKEHAPQQVKTALIWVKLMCTLSVCKAAPPRFYPLLMTVVTIKKKYCMYLSEMAWMC